MFYNKLFYNLSEMFYNKYLIIILFIFGFGQIIIYVK